MDCFISDEKETSFHDSLSFAFWLKNKEILQVYLFTTESLTQKWIFISSCIKLHHLNLPLDNSQILEPIQYNSSKLPVLHGHNQTENLVIIMKDYEK